VASRTNELDAAGELRVYRSFRWFWHAVMRAEDLGDEPQRVTLCEENLVIVRLNGEVCAFNDLCAHRGTALSLGKVVDGATGEQELRCPYHGWRYDRGGFCTLACGSRGDCPSDTTCADREGGICLFECTDDDSCFFIGAGWRCLATDLHGGGIKVMVCRGG